MKKIIWVIIFIITITICNIKIDKVSTNQTQHIKVEVKGNVQKPGVYEMPYKSTINDLLDIAIPLDNADLSKVNLASYLYPEMVVVIDRIDDNKSISINSADLEELCELPGIKDKLASEIIKYRNNHGSFNSLDEIMNVKGIGEAKYNQIKEYICL